MADLPKSAPAIAVRQVAAVRWGWPAPWGAGFEIRRPILPPPFDRLRACESIQAVPFLPFPGAAREERKKGPPQRHRDGGDSDDSTPYRCY